MRTGMHEKFRVGSHKKKVIKPLQWMCLLRENTDQEEEGTFGGQGKEKRSREVRDKGKSPRTWHRSQERPDPLDWVGVTQITPLRDGLASGEGKS